MSNDNSVSNLFLSSPGVGFEQPTHSSWLHMQILLIVVIIRNDFDFYRDFYCLNSFFRIAAASNVQTNIL